MIYISNNCHFTYLVAYVYFASGCVEHQSISAETLCLDHDDNDELYAK